MATKKDFRSLADSFEHRIRGSNLAPDADVVLVYHLETEDSRRLPPWRDSISPVITFQGPRAAEMREQLRDLYIDMICGNIHTLVRLASPDDLVRTAAYPRQLVRVVGFELEIGGVSP